MVGILDEVKEGAGLLYDEVFFAFGDFGGERGTHGNEIGLFVGGHFGVFLFYKQILKNKKP